ncbi:DUF4442 domain-containing protein [Thalassiella azotivora]
MSPRTLRRGMNLWPPFLFSGVRVDHIADDWTSASVSLRLRRFNRNYVGTHFGGSLFAMTDPFWMLLLMHRLGPTHLVWDQRAEIEFRRPGRGTVRTRFELDDARVQEAVDLTAGGEKALLWFANDVVDAAGEVVATVRKQVYVRRKPDRRAPVTTGA